MTTFEDAARAEAQRQYAAAFPLRSDPAVARLVANVADSIAEMARDHLAEQEASDAEVEEAARAWFEVRYGEVRGVSWESLDPKARGLYRKEIRAALRAAARFRKEHDRG